MPSEMYIRTEPICTSNEIEIDYTEQNLHWTTYYIRPLSFKAMSSLCYKNVLHVLVT